MEDKKIDSNIITPSNTPRGWHAKVEFIDDEGNMFNKGAYIGSLEYNEDDGKDDIQNLKIIKTAYKKPKKKDKKVVKKKKDSIRPLPNYSEIYQQYITDNVPFKIFINNDLIFDSLSVSVKKYPVFKNTYFILLGKDYKYKGVRIITK